MPAGPWELYQNAPVAGPWELYQSAAVPPVAVEQPTAPAPAASNPLAVQSVSDLKSYFNPDRFSAGVKDTAAGMYHGGVEKPAEGLFQLGMNARQWLTHKLYGEGSPEAQVADRLVAATNRDVAQSEADYQASRAQPSDFDGAELAGAMLSPINAVPGGAMARAAGVVPTALARTLVRGAGTGAGMAAAEPVTTPGNYWDTKTEQVGTGAALGAALEPAASALVRGVQGVLNPQKRLLLDKGAPLTPGQLLADITPGRPPSGFWKGAEDKAVSIPLIGEMVKARQAESSLGFNRAGLNAVLEPIGQKLPHDVEMGRDALDHVSEAVSQQYEHALRNLHGDLDSAFTQDLANVTTKAQQTLPPDQLKSFERIRDNYVTGRFQAATPQGPVNRLIAGDELKGIDSELGNQARGLAKDPSHFNKELGHRVEELQDAFRSMITRENMATGATQHVEELNNANAAYARWVRVRDAAAAANSGVYTPAKFAQSVVRNAATKNQAARGDALMQDLADAGMAVLPQTVPNSGTTDRRNFTELAMALLGGHAAGVGPGVLAGGLGAVGAYSQPGQALIRSLAAGSPQTRRALAEILSQVPATRGAVALQNQGQP